MGVEFVSRTGEEWWGRSLMSKGCASGPRFYEITKLLEKKLVVHCGILDESYADFFVVIPEQYLLFVEAFFEVEWQGNKVERLYNWAEYAAGMVENLTLEPWAPSRGKGPAIFPVRYIMSGTDEAEIEDVISAKTKALRESDPNYPKQRHPYYFALTLEEMAEIIDNTPLELPVVE